MRHVIYLGIFLLLVAIALAITSRLMQPSTIGPAVAPNPADHRAPVVQVYGADVWGFRGNFAIHTWVATKDWDESEYTIYQVIGWRLRRAGTALSITNGMPDQPWFRSPPLLLHEVSGAEAAPLVDKIANAVQRYPYAREYVMWPGPNSNSFTAWIALQVPELGLDLPAKAIGAGWMESNYEG
ncbi:MAG: DUF3750 domain-containing protein [Pseudomonadota bacterium]